MKTIYGINQQIYYQTKGQKVKKSKNKYVDYIK